MIIQKAKNTGTTVTFAAPVTAGSAIVVYVGFNDATETGSFVGCSDDQSQIYFGSVTLPSPWSAYGGGYDSGYDDLNGSTFLQTQSFFFFQSVAGVRTITVNLNGINGDIFAYELSVPSGVPSPNPSGNPLINTVLDDSNNSQDSTVRSFVPSSTVPMTELFPGSGSGGLFPSFALDSSELSMVLCVIDSGSFVSVSTGWTMDTQGNSAVMYREATEALDAGGVNDGVFTLSEAAYFAMSADDWYSEAPVPVGPTNSNLYSTNGMFDHSSKRADVLGALCAAMAGFCVPPGDQWKVFAGAYVTPVLSFTDDDLRGPLKLDCRISKREVANSIKGTFCPSFLPANPAAAISLNSVPSPWQSKSYPPYQANGLSHKPDYLNTEDAGQVIWQDANFEFCTDLWLAQRLAKITLMKLRYQQTITLQMKLTALQIEAGDTFYFTHPTLGFDSAVLEATQVTLAFESDHDGAPIIGVDVVARSTDPSVYEFTPPSSAEDYGEYSPFGVTGVMSGDE